jgi:hypothetical protein
MREQAADRMDVTIRSRKDGIPELAPKHGHAEGLERLIVIGTVLLVGAGLFLCGAMPAPVLGAIAAGSLAGEVVLGVRALALAVRRPRAPVLTLAPSRLRHR